MNRILLRNLILSGLWLGVVLYLIATHNAEVAAALFPSILALWMQSGREVPHSQKGTKP